MDTHIFMILLGLLLVVAFLTEAAFARLRIPSVLVLLACGIVLGPVTGILPAQRFTEVAPEFGALAFLLIIFEGGLDLDVRTAIRQARAGLGLAGVGFLAAFVLVMTAGVVFGLSVPHAAVLAVVLAPISGSILLPLAGQLGLRDEVRTVIVLEAAVADVVAVLAMTLVARLQSGGGLAGLLALGSVVITGATVVAAGALGLVWPRVLRRLGEARFVDALTFGVAMTLWGLAEVPGASGALAVLVFGLTLANEPQLLDASRSGRPSLAEVARDAVQRLHGFIAQLTFLVRAFFFVFLGVVVQFTHLPLKGYGLAATVVALLVVGRWLSIDFVESRGAVALSADERVGLIMLLPRGLVSAVLAIQAGRLGFDSGGLFLGVASLVIVLTNVVLIAGARRFSARPAPAQ